MKQMAPKTPQTAPAKTTTGPTSIPKPSTSPEGSNMKKPAAGRTTPTLKPSAGSNFKAKEAPRIARKGPPASK